MYRRTLERRTVLKFIGSAALLAATGQTRAQVAAPAMPEVEIGPVSALDAPGKYLTFMYPNQGSMYKSVVTRLGRAADGHTLSVGAKGSETYLRAYSLRCPHAGCTVDEPNPKLMAPDTILICPCHGSEYDGVNGALEFGPATVGLTALSLEVRGNTLYCTGVAPAL
ncbi:Rieske 2Fe-2S domain-containing protein (plasmid) [Deinococcus radiomollis]|uniref:Rieske 2Fe-2S domain-containing protein n=1 Tax=Deinococcus radiomollis TaxID=468916 RepID=UPI003892BEB4